MARRATEETFKFSRRDFFIATGGTLAGMAVFGLVEGGAAGKRYPQRGGTLHYGPHTDVASMDSHVQNQNH